MASRQYAMSKLRPEAEEYVPVGKRPRSAIQKVFETAEVLEIIIISLPAKTVCGLERVNKTWQSIIKDTRAGRAARCVKPLLTQYVDLTEGMDTCIEGIPHYAEDVLFHDMLEPEFKRDREERKMLYVFLHLPSVTRFELARYRDEFISRPPITTLKIYFGASPRAVNTHGCHLRIPDGIKIKDFIEVQRKIAWQISMADLYVDPRKRHENVVTGQVVVNAVHPKFTEDPRHTMAVFKQGK